MLFGGLGGNRLDRRTRPINYASVLCCQALEEGIPVVVTLVLLAPGLLRFLWRDGRRTLCLWGRWILSSKGMILATMRTWLW